MTQEEKQLLLKDLCARLPYGVIVTDNRHGNSRITEIDIVEKTVYCDDFDEYVELDKWKPYLRPMSSMTEEELVVNEQLLKDMHYKPRVSTAIRYINWLLENHFDFMGLIPKGLALEAPEGMYE